ncbi:hypothetical protein FEE95_08960 [Maribacter algarum]|uniref:Uncharacterized protein n=1 Tax=Maribacter algarum (ex Zhang et al. 2020) TaxID=2578118 RepID=A0A5S3QGG3_9FLAO|nr:hypothetical protein [Maribacter algarum]TMM56625.1 hypothetical protein FEE95_08960 [Maribacter algarum]
MKNSILLSLTFLTCTFGLSVTNAQQFRTTEKYTLINERGIGQEEEGAAQIDFVALEDNGETIAILDIGSLELLEDVHVTLLSEPNLEDISEILKVELEYSACCTSTDTYYFLVTDENDFIALPKLENEYCGETQLDMHYIFPSQECGQEGAILKAELQYTETYTIKDIDVLQSIVWNDDDFDYEDAITANY